jgi:hypothetical protein
MHREATKPTSSGLLGSDTYIDGCGPHRRNGDHLLVGSEGFALTTFLPGVEFEESEAPDKWGGVLL